MQKPQSTQSMAQSHTEFNALLCDTLRVTPFALRSCALINTLACAGEILRLHFVSLRMTNANVVTKAFQNTLHISL